MNLAKLFETQRVLDARIEAAHPRVEGEYRVDKKILSLQVELGELANEQRSWKFWSKDQEPRRWKHDDTCMYCDGKGVLLDWGSMNFWKCEICKGTGEVENVGDPLLEEYVDCLHFILSIGLELEFEYITECIRLPLENITDAFSNLFEAISILDMDRSPFDYDLVFDRFIVLGEMLGFTWDQVEQAYYDKNAINHARQESGY